MTVQEAYNTIKDRLNNLATNSGQGISERAFVFAYNKMQLHWLEERIKVSEATQVRQEEIQEFIKDYNNSPHKLTYSLTLDTPEDYFRYSRVYGICGECCQTVHAYPREEGNVGRLLQDELQKPSLEWEETFFTIKGNKIHFYADFDCESLTLEYYRCPLTISMKEVDLDGYREDRHPELTKTSLQEVLDLTVQLLSGDTLNPRFQTISQQIQQFN